MQRTADLIFRKLMELDHTVVLFDEIDELVRERDVEPDAFGRFLTTSMLPKLAELWEARKIMYFVATNHIEYFDRAVTRSQRFDNIIFMSPPSFAAKKDELTRILRDKYSVKKIKFAVSKKTIDAAKPAKACQAFSGELNKAKRDMLKKSPLPPENVLFKFALLRFDELGELALHLKFRLGNGQVLTKPVVEQSLDDLKDSSWRNLGEYDRYLSDPGYEHRDLTKNSAWMIVNSASLGKKTPNCIQPRRGDGKSILIAPVNDLQEFELPGYIARPGGPGKVKLVKE